MALLLVAISGHFSLCICAINRLHSTALPRWFLKVCDVAWYVWLLGVPLAAWYVLSERELYVLHFTDRSTYPRFADLLWQAYYWLCLAVAAGTVVHRVAYVVGPARGFTAATTGQRSISIRQAAGKNPAGRMVSYLATKLPLNEILNLSVTDKTLHIPRLDPALNGLTICHLSDLHLTGQWDRDFYRVVVEEALRLETDLIMITGDIVENRECLPWIPGIFGRLTAPLGVFFILGNHEQRVADDRAIRSALMEAGLVDVGGRWLHRVWRDREVLLAGNEMPWYPPAADLRSAPTNLGLRVALSHAPDQLRWAREHDVDLLLAGHTHGGQVRIPGLGPLLCPSRFGIRYASGVFVESPTVMHVSRGVAGTRPLRFRCPPEISRLRIVK
jgi:predicted MPP superfamily phosphohydrolase